MTLLPQHRQNVTSTPLPGGLVGGLGENKQTALPIKQNTDSGLIVYTNLSEDALKSMPEYVPPQS